MLLVNQIKLKPDYKNEDLTRKLSNILNISVSDIISFSIIKKSIDARKRPEVFYVLSVAVSLKNEEKIFKRVKSKDVTIYKPVTYSYKIEGTNKLNNPPVIVGAGPCGLFSAYELAVNGYNPIVIEQGCDVDKRTRDVLDFWKTGVLKPDSNVLFGEGGAGTFSDGKLNTLVKDKNGRNSHVLDLFVKYGAPERIKYENKPHIGTDILVDVVKNIRNEIINLGGKFLFETKLTDIITENGRITGIVVNNSETIDCEALLLCIGHSARDTFKMLYDRNVFLEQKDFAVGFRVEHKQSVIDRALYTDDENVLKLLPPSAYKLAYQCEKHNRGVYSFCMCPGGYVVNASSEEGMLCINGMSYSKRDGDNANSAIVMSVRNEDFGSEHPLAGIDFQRKIEKKAYEIGNGKIPYERLGEFKADIDGMKRDCFENSLMPNTRGEYVHAKVSEILPRELNEAFLEGMSHFDKIISGFNNDDTIVSGVESRTSSPVRITRDDNFESLNIKGIFPGGEGAGYAGGITSAAMDGIKLFEEIGRRYMPVRENKL